MSAGPLLSAKKVPTLVYTISGLSEDDMGNVIVGLHSLMERLERSSVQYIQADELQHTLNGQRAARRKQLLPKK